MNVFKQAPVCGNLVYIGVATHDGKRNSHGGRNVQSLVVKEKLGFMFKEGWYHAPHAFED